MLHKAWNSKVEMAYCFPRSSIKFQGHTGQNITDFDPNWAFPDYRPVAAFKSLRFALLSRQSRHHDQEAWYNKPNTSEKKNLGVSRKHSIVKNFSNVQLKYCSLWTPGPISLTWLNLISYMDK